MTNEEHPEDLLDQALAGELGAADRAALDSHLATCSACALHLALGAQLRGGTPTANARDKWQDHLAIAAAMERLQAPRPGWGRRFGRMTLRLAAVGVLLVAGYAVAAVSLRIVRAPRAAPVVAQPGVRLAQGRPSDRTALGAPTVGRPAPEPPALVPGPTATPPRERSAMLGPSAAALFERASDLRHQGRIDQAIETYRILQQRHPQTREANLSFAVVGRLQLERHRAAQALIQFDHYLRNDAEVAEEALAGRAEAFRRLGRPRAEEAAWRLLLTRFPASVYAVVAHSRLAALDSPSPSASLPSAPARR
jgi:tetratricopeptide (TPR) repeat protein